MPLNPVLRQRARAVATSINSHRILLYGTLSTVAVCAAVANALKNYSNFYSVAIYLSKSSRGVLVSYFIRMFSNPPLILRRFSQTLLSFSPDCAVMYFRRYSLVV